jgi:hypothetical protein
MPSSLLIGLAAGLVSAVVFVSATTGPPLTQLALFLLTPFTIYLAGLGLGWQAAAAGSGAGFLALGALATPVAGLLFAATAALPAVVLTYLALLNRPSGVASADGTSGAASESVVEWYPAGRLVVVAALLGGLIVLGAIVGLGQDVAGLKTSLEPAIKKLVTEQLPQPADAQPLGEAEIAHLAEIAVHIMPAAAAMTLMGVMLLNLYLAGLVTLASGRLQRPWPDLAAIGYPRGAPLLLALAIVATFLPGLPGLVGTAFAGSLYLAYVLLGLAILHYISRGQSWRSIMLVALYVVLLVMNTAVSLMIAILGLAESLVPIRARARPPTGGGPPAGT